EFAFARANDHVAAIATDAAAWKRNHASGKRSTNDRINSIPAGGQNLHARFVRMRIADDDAASVLNRWNTKQPRSGEPGGWAAWYREKRAAVVAKRHSD